jgi:hypothetical protein
MCQQGFDDLFTTDPFSAEYLLDEAANKVCRATDCFWREFRMDLVTGRNLYCDPLLYKIPAIYLISDTGDQRLLERKSVRDMDGSYFGWREWNTNSNPTFAVAQGMNRFLLAPGPSTDRNSALIFTGFSVTADNSEAQTFHLWPGADDECPMPQEAHDAVLYLFICDRLKQMKAKRETRETAMALLPDYLRDFQEEIQRLETFAQIRYSEQRRGIYPFGG